jgi:hypothetical protein
MPNQKVNSHGSNKPGLLLFQSREVARNCYLFLSTTDKNSTYSSLDIMCPPDHLNIVDVSDDMTYLHLKHIPYGYSLFFSLWPFQSN